MRNLKLWQKIIVWFLVAGLSFWGIQRTRRYFRESANKRRAERTAQRAKALQNAALRSPDAPVASKDPDDKVPLKAEHPATLQDEKNLKGRTLWVNDGGQMEYYPFNGKSVDFTRSAGVLLGAEKIQVVDAVEQAAPKASGSPETRFPDADTEVLLVFVRPDDARNPGRQYAVAIGEREGRDYSLLTDQLFFYEDPHQLYSYWGPRVWQSIDSHSAALGMTQHQLQMALGQVSKPRPDHMGDESVEYDNQNKPKLVKFVNGKAVAIRDESQ